MAMPLVIGLGSFHGDDQAGWLAIEQLQSLGYPESLLHRVRAPAQILNVASGDRELIVCDACEITADQSVNSLHPSTPAADLGECQLSENVHRLSWPTDAILYRRGTGSHDLDLGQVLMLGQSLRSVPAKVDVWIIRGRRWAAGSGPSDEVLAAAQQVADRIWSSSHRA